MSTDTKFKRFQGNARNTQPYASMGIKRCFSSIYFQKDIIISLMIMKTTKKQAKPNKIL